MSRRIIIDELEFEVPYGKLAAKTWHEETEESKRVLVLHGWMDNAGSFDNVMPLIKSQQGLYVVALDMPGHGKSSQLPPGSSYSDLNMLMEIRRILIELDWVQPRRGKARNVSNGAPLVHSASSSSLASESAGAGADQSPPASKKKFSIIGHSLGGGLALFYASLYPDDVDEIIVLDFIKAKTPPIEVLLKNTADTIDQFIETVPSRSPFPSPVLSKSTFATNKQVDKGQVVVSQEAAIVATIEAHKQLGELTRDDATCLLKRSTVAVSTPPNSVIYSRDLRLQSMLNLRESYDVHKLMFACLKCHVLIIVGTRGMYAEEELFRDRMDQMEAYYRQRAKSFHLQWLDGDHYLHMNRPKHTAEIINKYLQAPTDYQVTPASA